MSLHRLSHISVLVAAAVLLSACAPKQQPKVVEMPKPNPFAHPETQDMLSRVMAMQAGISELTASTAQLPGYAESSREADAVNRKLMYHCFDAFNRTLPVAEGPSPSGEFRVNMRVLESTGEQLNHMASNRSADPAIIEGLRVIPRLLTEINAHAFASDAGLKSKIDALQKTVNGLDMAQDVEFRIASAQAMREATDCLRWMEQNLSSRLAPTTATTQPSTRQSALPAGFPIKGRVDSWPTTAEIQPNINEPAHQVPTTQPSTPHKL